MPAEGSPLVALTRPSQNIVQFNKDWKLKAQLISNHLIVIFFSGINICLPSLVTHMFQCLIETFAKLSKAELIVDGEIPFLREIDCCGVRIETGLSSFD